MVLPFISHEAAFYKKQFQVCKRKFLFYLSNITQQGLLFAGYGDFFFHKFCFIRIHSHQKSSWYTLIVHTCIQEARIRK